MKRRKFKTIAALAAAAVVLAGCAQQPAAAGGGSENATGGDLVFAIANDPKSLNPGSNVPGNEAAYIVRQLVDSLLYQDPATGEVEPWLAESYEIKDEGRTYSFKLRDDVTFSDGTPLTAEAVKLTFDAIVEAGAESYAAPLLAGYQETVVVDEHTAEVRFDNPYAAFPSAVATIGLGIVAPSTQDVPFSERADGTAVVGTGPFVLDSYVPDESTALSARTDYAWGPESLGGSEAPKLDTVTFPVVPEASIRAGGIETGEFDVISSVLPSDVDALEAGGSLLVSRANPGVVFGLGFNTNRPGVSDPAVREAIALAIDPEVVRDTAVNSDYAVATSVLGQTSVGWADQSDLLTTNAADAAKLLDEAGWKPGADGIREKDGTALSLRIPYIQNFATNLVALEVIQQQLKEVGIGSELVGQGLEYIETLRSGDFDAFWSNQSRADGDILRTNFSTPTNIIHLSDPELDKILDEQSVTIDQEKRFELLDEAQASILTNHYYVPVYELTSQIATGDSIAGVQLAADSRLDSLTNATKSGD